jgi:hypothetical protein
MEIARENRQERADDAAVERGHERADSDGRKYEPSSAIAHRWLCLARYGRRSPE